METDEAGTLRDNELKQYSSLKWKSGLAIINAAVSIEPRSCTLRGTMWNEAFLVEQQIVRGGLYV